MTPNSETLCTQQVQAYSDSTSNNADQFLGSATFDGTDYVLSLKDPSKVQTIRFKIKTIDLIGNIVLFTEAMALKVICKKAKLGTFNLVQTLDTSMTENVGFAISTSENLADECGIVFRASTEKAYFKETDKFKNPFQRADSKFLLQLKDSQAE